MPVYMPSLKTPLDLSVLVELVPGTDESSDWDGNGASKLSGV